MLGRVLYLVPDLYGPPGGIARHGQTVCRALLDAGIDLTVLALHDRGPASLPPGRRVYRAARHSRLRFARDAILASVSRPDLVLAEHPHFSALGLAASRMAQSPLVVFVHGTDIWYPLSSVRRRALQHADSILCVSRLTADRAAEANHLDRSRLHVLYHCVDLPLQTHGDTWVPDDEPSLLTVSRISAAEQYKGHDMVIRALPSLLTRFPTLKYNIVGDGDGRTALQHLARDLGIDHAVRFHGSVSDEHLTQLYASASIYVMPSTGEGFGLAFLEAMAYGKPVIAGNRDAAQEVVRHELTGLVIDPRDGDALTTSIARILGDADLRRALGDRGAQVAATTFGFANFQRQLLGHLEAAIDRTTQACHCRDPLQ